MPENRLTLHIGLPKTATTTIQRTSFDNHTLLKNLGVDYCPELCGIGMHQNAKAHHSLPTFVCSPNSVHYKKLDESLIVEALKKSGELLLSSEGFTMAGPKHIQYIVDNWKLPENRRVVLVIRDELARLRSQWMQAVKTGHQYCSFKDYYLNFYKKGRSTVTQKVAIWEKFGFTPCVLRYEDLKASEKNMTAAFLESIYDIDIPMENWVQKKNANVSPAPAFVDCYQKFINRVLVFDKATDLVKEKLHPRYRRAVHNAFSTSKFFQPFVKDDRYLADLEFVKNSLQTLPAFDDWG